MHLFVLFPSMSMKLPKASLKDCEPLLAIIPFGIVAYSFGGQPFSQQMYLLNRD